MKKIVIWLFITTCSSTALFSQVATTQDVQKNWTLTLDQAKEQALKYNKSVKKAGLAAQQAQAAKWAAIATYLPQTSASMQYNNFLGSSMSINLMGNETKIEMVPTATATFQASQLIFNANAIVGIQLAELNKQLSDNTVQQTELAIKQNVSTVYYSILLAEDNKSILEKNIENIRTLVKATHARVKVGLGEQTQADQIDVTLANLENTLQSVNQNVEMAYNSMRLLLGVGADDALKLTDVLMTLTEKTNSYDLLAESFHVENNLDLKTSKLVTDMGKKQYDLSIASLLPSLTAVLQHNEKIASGGFDMTMKNTFVLQASVPLITSGKNAANVKKAKLAYQSSQLDLELAKDQLLLQEKQLRFNLKTAQASYELQKKNIDVSQRVFNNITKKYEQGLSSSLELSMANNDLLNAQSNYVGSVMSLLNAQDSLKKLLGLL